MPNRKCDCGAEATKRLDGVWICSDCPKKPCEGCRRHRGGRDHLCSKCQKRPCTFCRAKGVTRYVESNRPYRVFTCGDCYDDRTTACLTCDKACGTRLLRGHNFCVSCLEKQCGKCSKLRDPDSRLGLCKAHQSECRHCGLETELGISECRLCRHTKRICHQCDMMYFINKCPNCRYGQCQICCDEHDKLLVTGCVCDSMVCVECHQRDYEVHGRQRCVGCREPIYQEHLLTPEQRQKIRRDARHRCTIHCAECVMDVCVIDLSRGGYVYRGTPEELYRLGTDIYDISSLELRSRYAVYSFLRKPFVSTLCCGSEYCWKCMAQRRYGEEHECADLEFDMEENVRRCPGCNVTVLKTDGCNDVTCTACGCQFYFRDGQHIQ